MLCQVQGYLRVKGVLYAINAEDIGIGYTLCVLQYEVFQSYKQSLHYFRSNIIFVKRLYGHISTSKQRNNTSDVVNIYQSSKVSLLTPAGTKCTSPLGYIHSIQYTITGQC